MHKRDRHSAIGPATARQVFEASCREPSSGEGDPEPRILDRRIYNPPDEDDDSTYYVYDRGKEYILTPRK